MIKQEIKSEIRGIRSLIRNNNNRLEKLPEGKVSLVKFRNTHAFRFRSKEEKFNEPPKYNYVSLKSKEAADYATRLYLEKSNNVLNRKLKALEKFEKEYDYSDPAEVINDVPEIVRPLVRRPLLTMAQRGELWAKEPYDSNLVPFDQRTNYFTMKNERVRSRAEMIIADMLIMADIPYRYEAAFWTGERTVYPDFTIMNPETGELFYLEYFGLMNDPYYAEKQYQKIKEYSDTDCSEKFIYIFEYGEIVSMDTRTIKNLIFRTIFRGQAEALEKYLNKLS